GSLAKAAGKAVLMRAFRYGCVLYCTPYCPWSFQCFRFVGQMWGPWPGFSGWRAHRSSVHPAARPRWLLKPKKVLTLLLCTERNSVSLCKPSDRISACIQRCIHRHTALSVVKLTTLTGEHFSCAERRQSLLDMSYSRPPGDVLRPRCPDRMA